MYVHVHPLSVTTLVFASRYSLSNTSPVLPQKDRISPRGLLSLLWCKGSHPEDLISFRQGVPTIASAGTAIHKTVGSSTRLITCLTRSCLHAIKRFCVDTGGVKLRYPSCYVLVTDLDETTSALINSQPHSGIKGIIP